MAHGKASRLVRPLVMALSMKKYYKADTYLRFASAAIGIILVAIFAIMGRIGELSSLMAAVYQIVWFVPGIIAALVISSKNKKQ